MPNVILEAMACGTPVIATDVGGVPEVIPEHDIAVLVRSRDVAGIVNGVKKLFAYYPTREAVRRHAEKFSWVSTTTRLDEIFLKMSRS